MKPDCDVIIVGAGMAGMTAALWANRLGLSSIVLEAAAEPGGQLAGIQDKLIDFPGFSENGSDLAKTLYDQVLRGNSKIQLATPALKLDPAACVIESNSGAVRGRAIVISTGLRRRRIPRLESLSESFVFYTSQPRESFSGDRLLILGGGDGAVENALLLARQWQKISLVHRSALRARPALLAQLSQHSNVETILNSTLENIVGNRVEIQTPAGARDLVVDRILVKIGFEADSSLIATLGYDSGTFARVSAEQELLYPDGKVVPQVWVAGDVCTRMDPSLVVAAGQACIALRSIERQLRP
ncbi:MAG: NAD(P)/FAD-dependent oxidoreductase [Leptospirales bacterium]|nr:NAD(P)/FAD-dependent oxidoreductase [Leptospirales bacterium]